MEVVGAYGNYLEDLGIFTRCFPYYVPILAKKALKGISLLSRVPLAIGSEPNSLTNAGL